MNAAEILWLSGVLFGAALGVPAGLLLDRFLLRPSVRVFLAHRTDDPRRT